MECTLPGYGYCIAPGTLIPTPIGLATIRDVAFYGTGRRRREILRGSVR
jgi:hypothetical protein